MKILQITAAYKPAYIYGGPTMSVAELSEQLQRAGCEVQVFTTTANGTHELEVPVGEPVEVDGVRVTYFKRLTKGRSHFSPALLKAVWKQAKHYDVVHIHAWWNLVSVLSCLIALQRNKPVVISPRGMLSTYSFSHRNSGIKKLMHRAFNRFALGKCYLHATSKAEAGDLHKITRPAGTFTLPNFVKLPVQSMEQKAINQGPLQLLFYSRIDAKKGLELLLHALPLLNKPYHLTIAGAGDETYIQPLKALTEAHQTAAHVTWAGFQQEHKFSFLRRYDVMVLPSYNENFGNVVIESLSVGTAVLISRQVGLADYVSRHQMGWLCDTDSESIAGQIHLINTQRERLKEISQQAPAFIYNDFTGKALAQQYIHHYQQLIPHGV